MSFGTGGFGGFGSSNNNQASTGFGGFGASTNNNNTTGGFGANANTGFGANTGTTGGSLFGGGANNNTTTGGFGSGGFGSTANNTTSTGFGSKPAFGASTTGGGLFGSSTNNSNATGGSAFGGFGASTANNNNTTGGFGSSTTGGGLFGSNNQNKPAFGSTTNNATGGGLFGGGTGAGTSSFGQSTGGFGGSTTGFGQTAAAAPVNQGTASTPFTAHTEKDPGATSNSHFQSITFMQPYQNFSFEELRLADYNAGRRFGNSNGQAGAFGQSTGFGGFGSTNNNNNTTTSSGFGATANTGGGLFGSNNNTTTSGFGQNNQQQNTSTGFGSGGGLFGSQNKPAGGGLFGSNNATTTSGTTSGGLFGTTNNQTNTSTGFGGFGSNNNNSSTTGGGLFGSTATNNQNQAKPFGGFGTGNTSGGFGASTTGGFGSTNNNQTTGGGGLFGSSTTNSNSTPFGGTQQNNNQTGGGLFGGFGSNNNNQQNQQNTTGGGGLFGGGGFGQTQNNQNQQKPGGLFGSTGTSGGGLFGNNNNNNQGNQQTTGGGLFGNTQNNQQSGGLFGAKPATTGTGLFGSTTNNAGGIGGGLFGGGNQNQNQGTGLFGNSNNNNQQKSLFGSTTNNSTGGGGLFGGMGQQQTNNNGGGLFGGGQQQNNGGSLFGGSQQSQQNQQQPQSLTASLMQNPYGNDQLFAGLGTPAPSVGPLATPLSGAQKQAKRPQAVPAFKINPTASMRLITPQKRPGGYGFSYSNYGTPGSAQNFTPGRSGSLFNSSALSRPLSKSLSTSNLRSPMHSEESVLAPGAFTPTYRPYSSGSSIRRLKIDRTLRSDLFGDHSADRPNKRVSFDGTTADKNGINRAQTNGTASPGPSNALVRASTADYDATIEESTPAPAPRPPPKDARTNGAANRPEMEQVRGNELAMVPEDEVSAAASAPPTIARKAPSDPEPGDYYMVPSLQELRDMSRDQLKNISPFVVGRVGIGKVEFSKVDLTTVPLDQINGQIVQLNVRSATVYQTGVNTPPQGKGLNVPSTITLENSWPRSNGGRLPVQERKGSRIDKHIERLKRVGGTEFVNYNNDTGEWTFRVQHFTTYGLDDDDDETMMDETEAEDAPNIPTPKPATPYVASASQQGEDSMMSPAQSEPDDTFDFKKSGKTVPGGFSDAPLFEPEIIAAAVEDVDESMSDDDQGPSLLEDPFNVIDRSQGMVSPPETDDESNQVVGAFPEVAQVMPKSILKGGTISGTPTKDRFDLNDDWAEQLQRTVSPRKQDRQLLRDQQKSFLDLSGMAAKPAFGKSTAQGFNTTMDIMNSLWNQPKNASTRGRGVGAGTRGFEWPYNKQTKGDLDPSNMDESDRAFHASVKPRWASDNTLVYANAGGARPLDDDLIGQAKVDVVSEGKDVKFAALRAPAEFNIDTLSLQLNPPVTSVSSDQTSIPAAHIDGDAITFAQLADAADSDARSTKRERDCWRLASVLFDPLDTACTEYIQGVPVAQLRDLEPRIRRDAVLDFWRRLTRTKAMDDVRDASGAEEKALACLSCGDIEGACTSLVNGRDFKLATIVSQFPPNEKTKVVMKEQIKAWQDQKALSEFSTAVRAIYEIAAGNVCVSEGKTGAAEDRAPTFGISEHFSFDWRQSLGFRLFYGADDLAKSVEMYVKDVTQQSEKVKPLPEHVVTFEDNEETSRQDVLLGLLRLYAAQRTQQALPLDANDIFSPISVSGNPLDSRLSWQLASLLQAKSIIPSSLLEPSKLDSLTASLASQLELHNEQQAILTATTILQHLSTPTLRQAHLQSLLNRRADVLAPATHPFAIDPSTDGALQHLGSHGIPTAWLHEARALHAASHHDYASQTASLLLADRADEAHAGLKAHVGPKAVIERDYDALRELLGHFIPSRGQGDVASRVPGWRTGGGVYFDFVLLHDLSSRRAGDKEKSAVLKRLVAALPGVRVPKGEAGAGGVQLVGLEERVAVAEMGRVVEGEIARLGGADGDLERGAGGLPGFDEGWARQGAKLWGLYSRALQVR